MTASVNVRSPKPYRKTYLLELTKTFAFRYSLDETSPALEEAAHYEILSKATEEPTPADQCPLSDGMRAVSVAAATS